MYYKKAIALLCTLLILLSSIPAFSEDDSQKTREPFTGFSDVPESHYAYDAIMTMRSYGIINGYPDGTFRPNATVNRVEFATMMVNALKLEIKKYSSSYFIDMNKTTWAIPYVEAARLYLTGYKTSAGYYFKPFDASVREDMAVALVKALNKPLSSISLLDDYADLDKISTNLKAYVATAIDSGLMIGVVEDGKKYFNPQKSLTRAEAAQLLMNVITEEKITFDPIDDKVTFPSLDDHPIPIVKVSVDENEKSITVSWDAITDKRLSGYKIVASVGDSTPKYPDNGYYKWITDLSATSATITLNASYNGGDVKSFTSGKVYYISVTAVYTDKNVPGNVIKVIYP